MLNLAGSVPHFNPSIISKSSELRALIGRIETPRVKRRSIQFFVR